MFITESVGPFYFFPLVTTKFIHDPSNDHDNHLERMFGCRDCQTHVQLAGSESSTRKARRHHYPGIGNMSLRNSIAVLNDQKSIHHRDFSVDESVFDQGGWALGDPGESVGTAPGD